MKQYLFLLLAIACATGTKAQDYIKPDSARRLVMMADAAMYEQHDYAKAAQLYQQSFEAGNENVYDMYSCAMSYAHAGNYEEVLPVLMRCAEGGYNEPQRLEHAELFAPIRTDERYQQIYNKVKDNQVKSQKEYGELTKKMLLVILEDQRVRKALDGLQPETPEFEKAIALMSETDSVNILIIDSVLKQYGWLSPLQVGQRASAAPFFVIQHSDIKYQEAYYPMMLAAVQRGELEASRFALLVDRIRVRNGLPQLYGTQLSWDRENNKWKFDEILDAEHVDEHRASVGLEPLAEYGKNFGIE